MEILRSTPNELGFFKRFGEWMNDQNDRLWLITPFIDKVGVSMVNSSGRAGDMRMLTRRNKDLVNIKSMISIKMHENIHVKLYVGDTSAFFGSVNLTANSLTNNLEMVMKFKEAEVVNKVAKYFEVLWV
jgi:phosphatidylserine/phosphatidylglycerophosphate/cardiolipin synthase-like enzyme